MVWWNRARTSRGRSHRAHRDTEGDPPKIHVRSGCDPFEAISTLSPSLERITTSAGTPRASCAAIVCGPVPCDEPDPVVTLMPLVRSNSGNSCSYAPVNPPDIRTFNCADAVTGQISSAARMTTILFAAFAVQIEKVFTVSCSLER